MEYSLLPDLTQWATLRAVIERGGVSQAANALHVGQPAVTKRLRALEACYGMPLLERVAGRLKPTRIGEKVYLLAVQTLDRHAALRTELQNLAQGQTSMRLEVTFAIGEQFLPQLLLQFSERHPQYKIDSRLAYTRKIQTNLATGLTHLALLESAPDHPDILVQKWKDDELLLVCGAENSLQGIEKMSMERLSEMSFVLREPRSAIRDSLDEALRNVGITQLNVAMEVGSTEAIIEILARSKHVSFLPRFAVQDRLDRGMLYQIKVTGLRILRTLWIARHRDHLDHVVAKAFIQLLRKEHAGTGGPKL